MKLTKVNIHGYRSIRHLVEVIIEPTVTVVLGPNDHGKTNLLAALRHLNEDEPFAADDLNWDSDEKSDSLPSVIGFFTLTEEERHDLLVKKKRMATGNKPKDRRKKRHY